MLEMLLAIKYGRFPSTLWEAEQSLVDNGICAWQPDPSGAPLKRLVLTPVTEAYVRQKTTGRDMPRSGLTIEEILENAIKGEFGHE